MFKAMQEWLLPSERKVQVQEGLERKALQHAKQAPKEQLQRAE